jgi:pimeloyl-ACP methyl ester carboxylesterase
LTFTTRFMEKNEHGTNTMTNGPNHINFHVVGTEEPTLIFVHGFACALDDWEEQFKGLSPRFRCVALDLPGHGRSPKPETVSIEIMGTAVNRVKERIGGSRTILVGHSMGCRVITEAFQQSGSTIAGLVLVDGSVLGGGSESAIKSTKDAIDRAGIDAFTQRLFNDMFLEGSDPTLRERLIARAQSLDARFREELFLALVRWDVTKVKDALKRITVPALVLQSTYINPDLKRVALQVGMTTPWMDAVASLVPKSQAKIIPNAGHFSMIEAAQAVNNAIWEFATHLV